MFFKKENVYCPVCKTEGYLGERFEKDWFIGHCNDCRAEYYFPPYKEVPTKVITDRQKKNTCKCLSCEGRIVIL